MYGVRKASTLPTYAKKEENMNFKEWAIARYIKKDTPRGDFARDLAGENDAPEDGDRAAWLDYLTGRRACYEAIEAFKEMWAGYERWKKRTGH